MTEVEEAEREVANTKQRFQESLRAAGETGTRLAVEVRKKMTPGLVTAVVVGVAVTAGVALVAARSRSRTRWRETQRATLTGELARAAGSWVLRAIALRVALKIAARFREPRLPSIDPTPSDRAGAT